MATQPRSVLSKPAWLLVVAGLALGVWGCGSGSPTSQSPSAPEGLSDPSVHTDSGSLIPVADSPEANTEADPSEDWILGEATLPSLEALTTDPGNTPQTALNVGVLSTSRQWQDSVTGPTPDPDDYFRFQLNSLSHFSLDLVGRLSQTGTAFGLQLIRVSDQQVILNVPPTGTRQNATTLLMRVTNPTGQRRIQLSGRLQAGSYWVRIWRGQGQSTYTLTMAPQQMVLPGVVGTGTPASCTQAALNSALKKPRTVTFNCGSAPVAIPITQVKQLSGAYTINGAGLITLQGNGSTGILRTTNNSTLTLKGLTIANGHTSGQGGGLELGFWNTLTLLDTTFINNVATRDTQACDGGGAIFVGGGSSVRIENSTFVNNRANNGGAINNLRSELTVINSTFRDNQAIHTNAINQFGDCGGGGAIYIDGATENSDSGTEFQILGSRFENNLTNNHGGAIFLGVYPNDTARIEQSTFDGNRTSQSASMGSSGTGGAIWYGKANPALGVDPLQILNSTFVNNHADTQGGGLWTSAPALLTNVTFSGNQTVNPANLAPDDWRRGNGGAIAVNDGAAVELLNNTLANNHAGFNGGAIAGSTVTIRNTLFSNNTGANPWGIQQQCTAEYSGDHNLQFPAKTTANWNDYNCGSTIRIANPRLQPLANNGGATPTRALGSGSAAINQGNPATCPNTDQRGVSRGSQCDVGAYEF